MRAILIDPFTRLIGEVDTDCTLDQVYDLLGVDLITVVSFDKEHAMFLDDEGLLKPKQEMQYFKVKGADQPFAGRGLIIGDQYGDNRPATLTVEEVASKVTFLERETVEPDEWTGWEIRVF